MGFASADATSAEVTGGAGGIWLGGGGKDGGDGSVWQWDLLLRMQPAPR